MRNHILRHVSLGIENLLLRKLRSSLTMLGVVFGVGSVVAMLAVGEGASKEALDRIRRLGSSIIIVSSVKPAQEEAAGVGGGARMSVYGLTYLDHFRIAEGFPAVRRTAPVKLFRKESRVGDLALEVRVVGTTPEWFELVRRSVLAGRVLVQADREKQAPVAVLTEYGARRLLATGSSIGEVIRVGNDHLEVVGIVRSEGGHAGDIQVPDREMDAYMPIELARACFGDVVTRRSAGSWIRERVELHQIIVETDGPETVESTAAGIEAMLERFHKKKDFALSVPLALLKQAEATKRTFNIVLGSIAGISLLVGGIGIMNIMLASVTERTREIGIRRAIGALKRQIVYQFLIETAVLSTAGGIAGLGLGSLIPALITQFTGMTTLITPESILLPLFISVAVGIVFGLYPAIRAAEVDPIVALRHE